MQNENCRKKKLTIARGMVSKVSRYTSRMRYRDIIGRHRKQIKKTKIYYQNDESEEMFYSHGKIVKLSYNISKHSKILGRRSNKNKKLLKPSTPCNTGQYLISNFIRQSKLRAIEFINDYNNANSEWNNNKTNEIIDIEEICVTGGSMKGTLDSKTINSLFQDAKETVDFSTQCTLTEEEYSQSGEMSRKNSIDYSILSLENSNQIHPFNTYSRITRLELKHNEINNSDDTENLIDFIHTELEPS